MDIKYYTIVIISAILLSCTSGDSKKASAPSIPAKSNFKIVKKIAHDPKAFTQGLINHDGILIEGTGLNGNSWISTFDPISLDYSKKINVPVEYFGEGITVFNDKLYQLTYKKRVGFVYDLLTFRKIDEFSYPSSIVEGWGLSHNDKNLIVSDGSHKLYFLDTISFNIQKTIEVHQSGSKKSKLNELEFFEGYIYANVWGENLILKINPSSGEVVESYNLSVLKKMEKSKQASIDVLNGIAFDPITKNLIVTGKYWSNYYYLSIDESYFD